MNPVTIHCETYYTTLIWPGRDVGYLQSGSAVRTGKGGRKSDQGLAHDILRLLFPQLNQIMPLLIHIIIVPHIQNQS